MVVITFWGVLYKRFLLSLREQKSRVELNHILRPKNIECMAYEKDCKVVTTLNGTEYIRALAEDGSTVRIPIVELGKVMAKVMPVATSIEKGLLDRSKYILYDSYMTRGIIYKAVKIVTNISISSYKTTLLDIKILSYNYNGLISFLLKGNVSEGKIIGAYLSNGDFSGIESIYTYNENGKVCFTVNFSGAGLNISNGIIIANCCAISQSIIYDYGNSIVTISDSEKYVKGTNSNEIEKTVP